MALRRKHAQTQLLFWSAFILVHLVLFFLIPNEGRDASVLWTSVKWVLLILYLAAFLLNVRRFVRSGRESPNDTH